MRCQPQSAGTVPQGGGEIGESINSTKTACAAMCAQDPNCTSWQWHKNADTPNCALSNVCTLDDLGDDDGFVNEQVQGDCRLHLYKLMLKLM